ncbi:MAG: hypothetical protein V7607_1192 [Solirubrobacteraceae bacterium]
MPEVRDADVSGIYYGRGKSAALREAVHERLLAHEAAGELPTNNRFILYELRQESSPALYGSKSRGRGKGARSEDQNVSDACTWLREQGVVDWNWIVDETRSLTTYMYAGTVGQYLLRMIDGARLNCWGKGSPPLLLCESRTFGGVLKRGLAKKYLCPVAPTNGQVGGFLHTDVAPMLQANDDVLYVGDYDLRGADIEANTRRVLQNIVGPLNWTRIALTGAQVQEYGLVPVMKHDAVKGGAFEAVEVEALGQTIVTKIIREALDARLPEPLEVVIDRQRAQRAEARQRIREWFS